MNRRTIFITLGVFAAVIALAAVGYYVVKPTSTGTTSQTEQPIFGEIPEGNDTSSSQTNGGAVTQGEEPELTTASGAAPRLRQLSAKPVSGAGIFVSTTTGEFVRYVERESGHVFEAPFRSTEVARISNTTIPKTYAALWLDQAGSLLLRLLSDSEVPQTFLGHISSTGSLGGLYMDDAIEDLAVDQSGKQIFYIRNEDGGVSGIIDVVSSGKLTKIFSSPLTEWQPMWLGSTPLVLSNPSGNEPGYLYSINPTNASLTRILGDVTGLTAQPSRDGKRILFSETLGSTIRMHLLTLATGNIVSTVVATLPEKCVWSKKTPTSVICAVPFGVSGDTQGTYPDMWYQGRVSFSDNLWRIDGTTGAASLLYRFGSESDAQFDAVNLSLSPNEDQLLFQNKKDLSLWSVRLSSSAATSTHN